MWWSQFNLQAHKLRSMLRESERRSEEHREQLNEMILERERMVSEIEQLLQDNARSVWRYSNILNNVQTCENISIAITFNRAIPNKIIR